MNPTVEIPDDIACSLADSGEDLSHRALELSRMITGAL
jgi:hypothetical protein